MGLIRKGCAKFVLSGPMDGFFYRTRVSAPATTCGLTLSPPRTAKTAEQFLSLFVRKRWARARLPIDVRLTAQNDADR